MSHFRSFLVDLDHQLTAHSREQVREQAAQQRGAGSPEGFLQDGYELSDGHHRLVWDWQREGLAVQSGGAARRALDEGLAPAAQTAPLEREIRLTLAAFFVA